MHLHPHELTAHAARHAKRKHGPAGGPPAHHPKGLKGYHGKTKKAQTLYYRNLRKGGER